MSKEGRAERKEAKGEDRDMGVPAPRVVDANGLDSIFADGRRPSLQEMDDYKKWLGVNPQNGVQYAGTLFASQADVNAYKAL